jgi:hypothetical protein
LNLSDSWCPESIEGVVIQGTASTKNKTFFMATVDACNQDTLDKYFPGKVCKTFNESLSVLPLTEFYYQVKDQYFDAREFDMSPIKSNVQMYPAASPDGSSTNVLVF